MQTMILNGSPRPEGDCAALIGALCETLRGEIHEIRAYDGGVSPCVDCRYCWTHDRCAIDDGMQAVYRLIEACDNIVIASPVYFSELSGPLLSLASRLQLYWAARFFRNAPIAIRPKKGVLLLAGGGDGSHEKAASTARTLFHQVNAQVVAEAFSLRTNVLPAAQDREAMAAARRAGEGLARG